MLLPLSYVFTMTPRNGTNNWIPVLIVVALSVIAVVANPCFLGYFTISFRGDKKKDQVPTVSVTCSHNRLVVRQIEEKLEDTGLSKKQRAVLEGILWCVRFVDKDEYFHFIFTDYITMLYELTLNRERAFVREIAIKLARNAFRRADDKLAAIFPCSAVGKWDFISNRTKAYRIFLISRVIGSGEADRREIVGIATGVSAAHRLFQ